MSSYRYVVKECQTAKQAMTLLNLNASIPTFYFYGVFGTPKGTIIICFAVATQDWDKVKELNI